MHPRWDTAALQLALAMLLDLTLAEYPHVVHPVVWIGSLVKGLLRFAPSCGWWRQLLYGVLLVLAVCGVSGAGAFSLMWMVRDSYLAEAILGALLLKSSFALNELGRAAFRVTLPLEQGDLPEAREALRSLCSRDPSKLDAKELLAGTVESLAENASDSFVAPLFYFALFGIPGAMIYRAINTMDAMIGYRGKYEALGKSAARLDDVANWLPARLTAFLLLLTGWLTGKNVARVWRILRRDGGATPSPNAGRPMAVMAGLLGVRLEKKDVYILGDAVHEISTATVHAAWRLVVLLALLMMILAFAGFGLFALAGVGNSIILS